MLRHLGRYLRTAARVSRTRYPGFILGLPLSRDDIPVFTYHDVTRRELHRDLEFLSINGYRALSLDEYLHARRRHARAAGRSSAGRRVLLSFDDARKSFWQTALPLLHEFDARAVLFAPTYWMDPPSQRSLEAHGASGNDLFMTWPQLRACAASGRVDVQSHAHRHALVAVSASPVDFADPRALTRFDLYDWPMRRLGEHDELGRPVLGTPVYRSMPLLSAPRRHLESDAATRACQERVEHGGREVFFTRPGWRIELKSIHDRHARMQPGSFMPPAAFQRLLASEFEHSREAFEAQLGYAPRCIAYPWMLGSRASLELARRFGLEAAFGVALDYRAERDGTLALPVYGRLKCDWLRFMPGVQRHGALTALRKKLGGLAGIQHLAH